VASLIKSVPACPDPALLELRLKVAPALIEARRRGGLGDRHADGESPGEDAVTVTVPTSSPPWMTAKTQPWNAGRVGLLSGVWQAGSPLPVPATAGEEVLQGVGKSSGPIKAAAHSRVAGPETEKVTSFDAPLTTRPAASTTRHLYE